MQLVPTTLGLVAVAQGCSSIGTSTAPFLAGAKLKLINSSTVTLNQSTVWGSVSAYIGGYTGYADGSLSFSAPYTPDAGGVAVVSNPTTFRPTDSADPQNMYGAVVTDSASTEVLFAGLFDAPPIPMAGPLNVLDMTVIFNPATATLLAAIIS